MSSLDTMILPDSVRQLGIAKNYAKDAILHFQDEVPNHICYIVSGRVFATSINIDGEESWVAEYTQGQFMGCDSLFNAEATRYQLVAKTPVTGLLFMRESFFNLMNENPDLNNMVMADLSRQIKNFTVQTQEAHSLTVYGRIASELRRQAKPIGRDPDTFIIRPTPVFSELAQRLGSSRETVSRTVSKLAKKGVLERRTGALVVPDVFALENEIS